MSDAADVTPGELRRWLARVDGRVEQLDGKVERLDHDLRERVDRIDKVSRTEWQGARDDDRKYADETRAIAASARAWTWAFVALLVPLVLAVAVALFSSVR